MKPALRCSTVMLNICVVALAANPCFALISIGELSKEKAKEKYGISMHARRNGDAGIKVWLEFKREGWLEKFSYAELRVEDAKGKHLISAQLQPNPVHHRQPKDVTTVSFSAEADQLSQCSFLVVCYGSNEGDVGYYLRLKDFLDLKNLVTEDSREMSRGLDLTGAPRTSKPRALPDIWEAVPAGSASFEVRKGVVVYSELDGSAYYIPAKDQFYVQFDQFGSSQMTFHGPFEGDPAKLLSLEKKSERRDAE